MIMTLHSYLSKLCRNSILVKKINFSITILLVFCYFLNRNNVIANDNETEIKKVALATDAVKMNITPAVCLINGYLYQFSFFT